MTLLDTRTVYGIGAGVCNLYAAADGTFVVEVTCNAGTTSATVEDESAAWKGWLHPFAALLEIPSKAQAGALRRLSQAEHALLEAIEVAEGGEVDVA
jgi:hypothetical protein